MLDLLKRRALWILLCVVLAAGVVYYVSTRQTKKYTATASLVFSENLLGQQAAGVSVATSSNQHAQQSTNVRLVGLGNVAAKTARRLDHGLSQETVKSALAVRTQGDSNIVDVSATASSPTLAADIANTYTAQFVTEQRETNSAYYASASRLVARQLATVSVKDRAGSAGLALKSLAQSLVELAGLSSGNVRVAAPATVPTSASSPRTVRNTIIAAVAALLLGVVVALLLDRLDRRIKGPESLSSIYRLPLLGVVPHSRALAQATQPQNPASLELLPLPDAEAFQLIRAHVRYFNADRELRTVLVTSAEPRAGKTTIARHLAVAAASMGSAVLLVEADLRRPTLAQQLNIAEGPGVADVVVGSLSLWRATQPVAIDQRSDGAKRPLALDVLVAGSWTPPNPAQLIESRAMAAMLGQASEAYDLVVVDSSPPCVADSFPLLRRVDGVVVVGRMGRSRRPAAERLRETLQLLGAPVLGVIANDVKTQRREPYYAPADDAEAAADQHAAELAYDGARRQARKAAAATEDRAGDGAKTPAPPSGAPAAVESARRRDS